MKIKTKLNLGIGLLFTIIVLLAVFAVNQINLLSNASFNILKDNKETISYIKDMLKILSEIGNDEKAVNKFEDYLKKQKQNITETGEKELTQELSDNFNLLKNDNKNQKAKDEIETVLLQIIELNLKAIEQKNKIATNTAQKSIIFIGILGIFCIIIALILFLKLPGNISNPIKELIESIKRIAANDYSQRVNFETHSEFGELATSFNIMASKLDEYNKSNISQLLAEKKIIETLINKIQYPIIGLDKNLKINFINEEFLKISKLKNRQLIGQNILEVATNNELISKLIIFDTQNSNLVSNNNNDTKICVGNQGKEYYFEKEIQEICYTQPNSEQKHMLGYVIILKNITRYMELDLAKTRFIATISHELKTPISAIKLSLQLLENEKTGKLNEEQRELIKSSKEDLNSLLKIIFELLNMTQAETGNIQLNMMPIKLSEILNQATNINKPLSEQKNIKFEIGIPSEITEVMADKDKTIWVLTNLISNAIYNSNDDSKIIISASEFNNQIVISIRDFGKGIDAQYINRIFERYFRIPGSHKGGSGLGLAICKEFIEAQGGKITVESEFGAGSIFTIVLNCKN